MLPYDTPSPADLDRLMRGELVSPPRLKNPKIPKAINDIVMKAMAPDIHARYQRAGELLDDVLAARSARGPRRAPRRAAAVAGDGRRRARRTSRRGCRRAKRPGAAVLLACRKPLHARTDRCPFCGETQ